MSCILLETIDLGSFEELCKAMADDYKVKREWIEKYPGKQLSFQTVSNKSQNLYRLNAFEIAKGE